MRFGTAGIREVVGEKFNEAFMDKFAIIMARLGNTIVVGHDNRVHSKALAGALLSGLVREGARVYFLGTTATPVVSYATREFSADFGIMITASHNPPEYNGIKVVGANGRDIYRSEEERIETMLNASELRKSYKYSGKIVGVGDYIDEMYIENVESFIEKNFTIEPSKVFFDAANGTTSKYTPKILSDLGHNVFAVNSHQDGTFPGRLPEPTKENVLQYIRISEKLGFDIYIGQDGDGDRVAAGIDGHYIIEDYVTSFFIKEVSNKFRGSKVVLSPNISPFVHEYAKSLGFKTEVRPLGYLHEGLSNDTIFLSEPWKIMIPSYGFWFDGIMASAVLSSRLDDFRKLLEDLPKVFKETVNLKLRGEQDKWEIVRKISNRISQIKGGKEVTEPWGLRVVGESWWVLIRPSGTEQKIRAYVEAYSKEMFDELVKIIKESV